MNCARDDCDAEFDRSDAYIVSASPVSSLYYCSAECFWDDGGIRATP